ncbi:MAG TPA: prepilin-type N-terminal cleavage/methylation domain-containing protein [bacterium]|nr:prepilin-type N-terminal cleavage/methylation domain-containing protein [bacterium]HNS48463.1 prepilin-type N-terminal cleavage/methylation domain-containing protein [bacterium]
MRNQKRHTAAGFTLLEMLTTAAILAIVFGLLAIIFSRATTLHRVVRSGGDAENFGIYVANTILYGPGASWEQGLLAAAEVVNPAATLPAGLALSPKVPSNYGSSPYNPNPYLIFRTMSGDYLIYKLKDDGTTILRARGNNFDETDETTYIDLKPGWASDRQLDLFFDETAPASVVSSGFYYYTKDSNGAPTPITSASDPVYYVKMRFVLRNILQSDQEAVVIERHVRVRNQILF